MEVNLKDDNLKIIDMLLIVRVYFFGGVKFFLLIKILEFFLF